jgi:hypothetical protein
MCPWQISQRTNSTLILVHFHMTSIIRQESKLHQTTQQLNQTREEFQQYKQRAHALLQEKNSDPNTTKSAITDAKTSDLQLQIKKLQAELRLA